MQKIIGTIHKNQVTKIYDDKGRFVCTFVIEYKGSDDEQHKMSVYAMNIEPHFGSLVKSYLFELDIYSIPNTTINNGKAYTLKIRVLSIQELTSDLEVSAAEETVNQWYKDLNKLPYVCEN
jgi:hypothetical protein